MTRAGPPRRRRRTRPCRPRGAASSSARSAADSWRAALVAGVLAVIAAPAAVPAQGPNFARPAAELEALLADAPFQIVGIRDNRWQGDRTQITALRFEDGFTCSVKWAKAPPGGFAINNQPRYEVAAYEFQKLFLDEGDLVVPPTVIRELPLRVYRQLDPETGPTFEGTSSVLVALQYWLQDVDTEAEPDLARASRDGAYAHRLAILNLFTHLIRHVDSNPGNVLVSTRPPPRLFAVDNGVAFRSPESPRGTLWRELHVDRVPAAVVRRLRALTRAELEAALYVVAQFEVRPDGRLEAVEPTAKLDENRGVDRRDGVIQLGLTNLEMDELWARIQAVVERVDAGALNTYAQERP